MFSGLYGDLPEAKDESEKKQQPDSTSAAAATTGTWSGSAMLVPTAKRPAPTAAMPPPSVLLRGKPRADAAPAANSSKGQGQNSTQTGPATAGPSNPTATASASFWGSNIVEEYDPNRPNDYDAICRRKEQLRLETVAEAERQERLREIKELEELERIREDEAAAHMEMDRYHEGRGGLGGGGLGLGGTAAAAGGGGSVAGEAAAVAAAGGPKGMTLAQRMLEKMGWKQGEGLGKSGQGIAAPLAVQKTDARSGRVGKFFFLSYLINSSFDINCTSYIHTSYHSSSLITHYFFFLLYSCSRASDASNSRRFRCCR
jgi:splicing factor 45